MLLQIQRYRPENPSFKPFITVNLKINNAFALRHNSHVRNRDAFAFLTPKSGQTAKKVHHLLHRLNSGIPFPWNQILKAK
jgi:hypothetical protein